MRFLTLGFTVLSTSAFAESFDRPIPQAQSATAELWFAAASLTLLIALYFVHRLVMRK